MDPQERLNHITQELQKGHFREAMIELNATKEIFGDDPAINFLRAYALVNLNSLRLAREFCMRCIDANCQVDVVEGLLAIIEEKLKAPLPVSSHGTFSLDRVVSVKTITDGDGVYNLKDIFAIRPYYILTTEDGKIFGETTTDIPFVDIISSQLIFRKSLNDYETISEPCCVLHGYEAKPWKITQDEWRKKIEKIRLRGISPLFLYSYAFPDAPSLLETMEITSDRYRSLSHEKDYFLSDVYFVQGPG